MTPMVEPFRGRSLVNALAGLPRQTVLDDVSAPRSLRRLVAGGSWRGHRWILAACALQVALFAQGDAEGRRYDIDIRDADAPAALRKLAEQTESLLLFPFELARDRRANPVVGRYTIEEALARLLDGSGLAGVLTNQRVISVVRVEPAVERSEPMTATTETTVPPVPRRTPLLRRIGATVAAVLAAPGIFASESGVADSGEQAIEVILVTAEKREENMLDVPVTMTAFSNQMIEELGMTNHDDLEQLVPGLQFQDEGTQTGQGTTIRGIGTRLAGETVSDLAVATYVDGVYTLGLYGVAPNMFDLERVEVARGPQGTLHGRNSIAGAISYFSRRPTDHWDLLVHTEFTDQFTQRYGVAYGGPISENLSFRINGSYYEGDGAQKNIGHGNDYDAPDQIFLAPQLRFRTDRIDLNLRYTKLNDEGSPRTQVLLENVDRSIPESRNPNPAQSLNAFYLWDGPIPSVPPNCPPGTPAWECGDVENVLNVNRNSVGSSTAEQATIAFSFDLNDHYTLRYNFGDTDNFSDVQVDQDQTNRVASADDPFRAADADAPLVDEEKHVLYDYTERSHELQLVSNLDGPLNFIVGAFTYENYSAWFVPFYVHTQPWVNVNVDDAARGAGFAGGCPEALALFTGIIGAAASPEEAIERDQPGNYWACPEGTDHSLFLDFQVIGSSETQAAFVNAEYQVNDQWLVSGGLRYTEDEKAQDLNGGVALFAFPFIGPFPFAIYFDDREPEPRTWGKTIGHISLEHTPDENRLIYGRISTGYRAGNFQTKSDAPPKLVKEETLINYELGMKGLFMDGRLRLTTGVFYNDFDDYQISGSIEPQGGTNERITDGLFDQYSSSPIIRFTNNIQDTKIWGAEVDFIYYVNENWRLSGFLSYLDSEIGPHKEVVRGHPDPETAFWDHIDFSTGEMVTSEYILPSDMTGNQLPLQPNYKFALTASYETSLAGTVGGHLQLLGTYSWVDERASDLSNFDISTMPAYGRFDVRGTWTSPDETITTTLFVQNVFDEIGVIEYLHLSTHWTPRQGTLTDPRSIGLEVRWRPNL